MTRSDKALFWVVHIGASPLAIGGVLTAGFLALVLAEALR